MASFVAVLFLICYFLAPATLLGTAQSTIASRWRELHGNASWTGLLDPLDVDLRRVLISYGELAQATYDSFNGEKRSPHAGACRYGYSDLLTETEVSAPGNYAVTKFVYATSAVPVPEGLLVFPAPELKEKAWSRESNFMGYVAVATDQGVAKLGRRDIVVVWRGTVTDLELLNDLDATPVSAAPVLGAAAKQNSLAVVFEEVRRLMQLYKDEVTSITITGHSLGAALATLNAVDIVANGLNNNAPTSNSSSSSSKQQQPPSSPVTAMVFASPHVGDRFFRTAFRSFTDLRALHVKNTGDVVPKVLPVAYVDVAVPLPIDTARSPYLRSPGTVETFHDLECYLHGVAGDQGSAGGSFKLEVDRDVALVNKHTDALKDECPVPANWWVPKNKGMVKNTDGKWELKDFEQI
ncbi:hypothetical protein PR202_gb25145 [Eleusine coracana subsp. coracana]|uniref:Phospholipase A1 n=1 Tax=Eleusine coracana subsp. coracana TaxID=191504 RepID=A0AAV5FKI1_ELECO|nr:hypothetical protein PR202_gb25145 [Eleusine coracana subsp. coracana]